MRLSEEYCSGELESMALGSDCQAVLIEQADGLLDALVCLRRSGSHLSALQERTSALVTRLARLYNAYDQSVP